MALNFFNKFRKKEKEREREAQPSERPKVAVPEMPGSHADEKRFRVQAEGIMRKLVMTAKAGKLGKYERYVFEVATSANKIEIKKAFTVLYGVSPLSVRTSMQKQQEVRFGRLKGYRKKWKKATITIDVNKSVTIV